MKKLFISLILIMSVILSTVPVVNGKSVPDVNGINEKAVDFVTAIGIMDVSENGNFEGDKNVTRAEFCQMVYKLFNMNTAMTENHFKDVYEDTPEINEINALVEMGVINGVGDNKFEPGKEINLTESIKIILDMMGYKSYCNVRGGYPLGYIMTAKQIGLIKDAQSGVSKREIAQILYNAALCEIPEIESINTNGSINISTLGTTLLEEYHDIYRAKGVVTANHLFSIDGEETTDFGEIRMNGVTMELENDPYRLYDSVGYYADIFYRYEEENDKRKVVYGAKDSERSNEEVIETDDIINYSSYTIHCDGGDKYSFGSSAIVLKNNMLLQSYGKDDFTKAYGKIVCTSYENYNVVRIIDWDIYVVNFVSLDERRIYHKSNPENPEGHFELSENNVNITYSLHDAYGRSEKLEKVKPGDVLCVSEGDGFLDITRITEKKTHTITAIGSDKYYYDGGYFELAPELKQAVIKGDEPAPEVGESIQVVYDLFGRAAGFFERTKEGEMLVFLINAAPKSKISETYEFLFMTASGEFIVLESNDKITYTVGNSVSKPSGEGLFKMLLNNPEDVTSGIKRQVAYIKTNSQNKLVYFEGASESDEEKWVDGKLCKEIVENAYYKKEPMSLGGKASGNAETVVFSYPESEDDRTNMDEYSVCLLNSLANTKNVTATVYRRDKEKIPFIAMAVVQKHVNTTPTSLFVIDEITRAFDKEDGEIIEITGFENGTASSIRLLDENVIGNSLSCGDVIRYTRGANGYVTEIDVKHDNETSKGTPWSEGKFTDDFHIVTGTAELVDGNYVKINKGETIEIDDRFEIQRAGSTKITVVDTNNRETRLRAGTMEDILDARSENPSFLVVRSSSGTCYEIIIYR